MTRKRNVSNSRNHVLFYAKLDSKFENSTWTILGDPEVVSQVGKKRRWKFLRSSPPCFPTRLTTSGSLRTHFSKPALLANGWFPLSRSFYVLTCVTFAFAFKIEAMYERSHVNVKVEPHSISRLHSQHFICCLYFITWLTINVCSRVKLCSQMK